MQLFQRNLLVAVLMLASSGCGGKKDGDAATGGPEGQPCQASTPENGGKYLCPEGYFCKYPTEEAMQNTNEVGKCRPMAQYKPCMNITPCDSQYSPKCETANESAFCDSLQATKLCKCEKPGPFTPVEGEGDGEVKTPTTTK